MHIARTAQSLFVADGDTSATIGRIAEAAGVSERTFYRHFPVKEDVVLPLFAASTQQLLDALRAAPSGGDSVNTLVTAWAPVIQHGIYSDADRAFLMLMLATPEYRFRWMQIDDPLIAGVTEFLEGRLRQPVEPSLRTLPAALLVHAMRHVFECWLRSSAQTGLVDLLRQAFAMVLACTDTGSEPAPSGAG